MTNIAWQEIKQSLLVKLSERALVLNVQVKEGLSSLRLGSSCVFRAIFIHKS